MKNWWPFVLFIVLTGCSEKKIDLSGDTPVKVNDFLAAFPKMNIPFAVADTNMTKAADTTIIGYKALQQFFPDSTLTQVAGNQKNMVIRPVGKIEKEKENYLLLNFYFPKKIVKLVVFVTDKKNKFLAAKELLSNDRDKNYSHTVSINREPTFLISKEKTGKDNLLRFSRTGWVYSSVGIFMVVINDSNEDPTKADIINPIDTLPRKNKFSGEYIRDKKNFISIRDSQKPGMYLFFIHFEKNAASCTGELKGEMKMKDPVTAQYTGNGDPCVIDFSFGSNRVTFKEQGTCGNHRGIKCFFEDTFIKKKEPKVKRK